MLIGRRTLGAGVAALGALGGAAARAQAAGPPSALVEAAAKEGVVTWYNGYLGDTPAQEASAIFQRLYPGVRVEMIRSTSQVAWQRLAQDRQANLRTCDVYSSSDIGHFAQLYDEKRLAAYTPQGAAAMAPALRPLSQDGAYYPALVSLMSLAWNTKLVQPADVPKNWPDLLDPRWRRRVACGHPGFSGYAGTWALLMRQLYGDGFFASLAKNEPLVGRSSNDAVTHLVSGERSVAAAPAYVAFEAARRGNPVAVGYPTDGALLMVSPAGALADAPHPSAARLFMEFLLGPDYSRFMVTQGAEPVNASVPPAADQRPLSEVKLQRPKLADILSGIPDVAETWRDAFGS